MNPNNKVYGKQFNRKWMTALYAVYPISFTTKEASRHYQQLHPNDKVMPGMNARNYLAGGVTTGWIKRVEPGYYAWTKLAQFQCEGETTQHGNQTEG